MTTLAELIAASGLPALEARVLSAFALKVARAWIVAHDRDELTQSHALSIARVFERRRAGEPVAYITGEREFHGLAFNVAPAVLIPRPETEQLVEIALAGLDARARVLDLGTGSGAIAVAIAQARPDVQVTGVEASAEALMFARANAARHGVNVRWIHAHWFEGLTGERFDRVISNPPYIAAGDAHLAQGDLRFEPRQALVAGPTGMECIEAIAREAPAHLVAGGRLLMEHGFDQGNSCTALFEWLEFRDVRDHLDLQGLPRVIDGRFDPGRTKG